MIDVSRGDVWIVDFGPPAGRRPAVVLTRGSVIPFLRSVTVVEVTTTVRQLPTEVPLDESHGLTRESVVNCDNLATVPKDLLAERLGVVGSIKMREIGQAVRAALDL